MGKAPDYPVKATGRATGGQGNPGVAAILNQTPYSIGFVEWNYAIQQNMTMALLRNANGNYVLPTTQGIIEALNSAGGSIPLDPFADFSQDIKAFLNLPGNDSYPIIAATHLLVWGKYQNKDVAKGIATFLEWILKYGDNYIVPGYAPVGSTLKQIGYKAVEVLNSQ
ncbi:substrate-binding domain-containing protein [Fervidicoccus fontis]|uniref:Substrate-binding domain-containing protein n=2 Tax=Fervidicoccus fontis TaxID=683846 RepID=A0A843AJX9_9CREN|nr:substrate-binding domain-containing protein [Fervidicoccus fontis]MBE9391241.1 substrate-binding domain-containing protein [Fervidicoccus fontis]